MPCSIRYRPLQWQQTRIDRKPTILSFSSSLPSLLLLPVPATRRWRLTASSRTQPDNRPPPSAAIDRQPDARDGEENTKRNDIRCRRYKLGGAQPHQKPSQQPRRKEHGQKERKKKKEGEKRSKVVLLCFLFPGILYPRDLDLLASTGKRKEIKRQPFVKIMSHS